MAAFWLENVANSLAEASSSCLTSFSRASMKTRSRRAADVFTTANARSSSSTYILAMAAARAGLLSSTAMLMIPLFRSLLISVLSSSVSRAS